MIDVVIPTKNSARRLGACLNAVYREIPVCHLIVVDANSNDGTIEIVSEYPNVELVQGSWNLGKARQVGISRVHTDFFAFVDSDVLVTPDWMEQMFSCMQAQDVGAVEGMGSGSGFWYSISERLAESMQLPHQRPFTGNTLIRTSLMEDIELPDVLLYEDYLIRKHIEAKGFRWLRTSQPVGIHLAAIFEKSPREAILAGQYAWQFKSHRNIPLMPILLFLKIVNSFVTAHKHQSDKALRRAIHESLVHIYYTCGFLKGRFSQP